MIEMLHSRLIGENRTRFGRLAGPILASVIVEIDGEMAMPALLATPQTV